jgi:hypothetical protein
VLRPEVDKHVRDYFADYARNRSGGLQAPQVRQGLVHKYLGEALDIIAEQNRVVEDRKPAETVYSDIYLTYSNYVHAKYPEVMDFYGGGPGPFHLDGMQGAPKDDENFAIIETFINTAAIALKLIVSKLRLHHLLEADAHYASGSVRRSARQAGAVSLAASKLYTRAVLPPAILACSKSRPPRMNETILDRTTARPSGAEPMPSMRASISSR